MAAVKEALGGPVPGCCGPLPQTTAETFTGEIQSHGGPGRVGVVVDGKVLFGDD